MPAIQVARTDTFELQRQKINQIGQQIFNISAGGSDLATGNLKIGNGSISAPSLAFDSENTLGFYRPTINELEFVASEKRLVNISASQLTSYKDVVLQKNILTTQGSFIISGGQNYESGTYQNVDVIGGSGTDAKVNIGVEAFGGSVTTEGLGYSRGSFSSVNLTGGNGNGATVSFAVDGLENGTIVGGSGYTDGVYDDINLTNVSGSGVGAIADIVVISGSVATVSIQSHGSGYETGDILSANSLDIGGTGSGFTYTITSNPGVIDEVTFTQKNDGYLVGDILKLPTPVTGLTATLPGQITGVSTTLSDSTAQITVSSTTGIIAGMTVSGDISDIGILNPGTTVLSIDSSTTLTLSSTPLVAGSATLSFTSSQPQQLTVSNSGVFNIGDVLTVTSGSGQFAAGTTVSNIINATTIFISAIPTTAGSATFTASPPFGSGTQEFEYTVNAVGTVASINVSDGGNGYAVGDVLSVNPTSLLQTIDYTVTSQSTEKVTFSPAVPSGTFQVGQQVKISGGISTTEVYYVKVISGNIDYIIIGSLGLNPSDILEVSTNPGLNGTVATSVVKNKYFIDTGSGAVFHPNITLYAGDTYRFTIPIGHDLAFSRSPDGPNSPGNLSGITSTLSASSKNIDVASTTDIVIGMLVNEEGIGDGQLDTDTRVEAIVDSNTITLSKFPLTSGEVTLSFTGAEYTDGVVRTSSSLTIKVTENTPSTLYYYCSIHPDMAGEDGDEAIITVDNNNPRLIGSGFTFGVSQVQQSDLIYLKNSDGSIAAESLDIGTIDASSANISTITSSNLNSTSIQTTSIVASSGLSIQGATTFNSNVSIGSGVTVNATNSSIVVSGDLRTNSKLNVSNTTFIEGTKLFTTSGDLELQPASGRIAKISSNTSLQIPVGTTAERPTTLASNGSIRFNTTTGQYEGYNSTTSSWSSLGGVRDIDGNTYIIAELTAGANDNTLWFYNDNNNTLRLTTQFLDFRSVKKISSGRLGLPAFITWTSNTPVSVGQFIKYRNNIYEVTGAGATATSGNEPTHTSGTTNNGTAQLTWYSLAVSPLEFTEVEELRVGPNKDCPLIISAELKLFNKTISTLTDDLIIQPALGKKVVVDSTTHFAIPAGNDNQKSTATAQAGSIRYNTTISQFEGYSGTNWSSLGGVRDVDGNTYIIPETAPGANENILYFYNDNLNTVQLSKTTLDFTNIDTITTSGLGTLALDTPLVTLNLDDTTIDNRDVTRTFISTSKQYLDLGLSSGLVVDPVLRLDDQGDVYLNTGFGTGSFVGVKIFDGDLKEFELADYAVKTSTFSMEKGNSSTTAVLLYALASAKGCQVSVMSKSSTGKKSLATYNVIDNGSDIFHNEFGSLNTSADGFSATFDITPEGVTRITLALSNDHSNGDIVEFTVITQVYK